MIDAIPRELFTIVGHHLSYSDLLNVSDIIELGVSEDVLFAQSNLFYKTSEHLKIALNSYNITPEQLFNILNNSALDINDTYELLMAISTNNITNVNKYDYNISINYDKTDNLHIKNTIIGMQIVMISIEHYVTNEFIINNPYHYTSINITNTLLNYFHTIVSKSYTAVKDIKRNSFKFNLMMFEFPWYKSNINIYHVFLLYLLNINAISSQYIDDIYEICNKSEPICCTSYPKDKFIDNVFHMFQNRDHLIKLNQIICHTTTISL